MTAAAPTPAPQAVADVPPVASTSAPRARRTGPQLLADELLAEELIEGAPSRNGGRLLTAERDPWTHNAWDRVEWDEEQEKLAQELVEKQASVPVPDDLREAYNADPASYWDTFYARVQDGFFNDRSWLRTEFSELADAVKADAGPKRIVEIGCGPGNTLFPLIVANENPLLQIHGVDFSREAIEMVKKNASFDPSFCHADVWSLASKDGLPASIQPGTVDVAIMIFVMSALHPDEWAHAVENTWTMLKPGGILLFRDYGRHDLAQLRFKSNRYMQPALYVRGDGTRVYFFERDELVGLFGEATTTSKADPTAPDLESLSLQDVPLPPHRLELLQLGVDRRLLLNRKKQLKMYRIWLQGRWRKAIV